MLLVGCTDERPAPPPVPSPTVAPAPDGFGERIVETRNGEAVLVLGTTSYRVYDDRWQPLSPLLALPQGVSRAPLALDDGFVLQVDQPLSWLVVDRSGALFPVGADPDPAEVEPRDVLFDAGAGDLRVFRPSPAGVHPPSGPAASLLVPADAAGAVCVPQPGRRLLVLPEGSGQWQTVDLPAEVDAPTTWCSVRQERLTVVSGAAVQSFDLLFPEVLTAPVPAGDGPVGVLADGRLVWSGPDGRPVVATDPTNQAFVPVVGPLPASPLQLVGDRLVYLLDGFRLLVSRDGGQTWRVVDLSPAS